MVDWIVKSLPAAGPDEVSARSLFQVHPEGEPEHWVVQTNPQLLPKTQADFAELIAELLSTVL